MALAPSSNGHQRQLSPTEPSPARRVVHLVIAGAGWALYLYWWWLVLQRVSMDHVRFTGIFLGVTLIVVVGVTALWSAHNLAIHRRRGDRKVVRTAHEVYERDRIGRRIAFKGTREELRSDPVIQIRLEHEGKTYRPSSTLARSDNVRPLVRPRQTEHVTN